MFKLIIITMIITLNLFGRNLATPLKEYRGADFVTLKIKYLNFEKMKNKKDKKQFKEWFNDLDSPVFLAHNLKQPNDLSIFNAPHRIIYSGRNHNIRKKSTVNALGISYMVNEYFKARRYTFEDEGKMFGDNKINVFKLNEYVFINVSFSDKYYKDKSKIPKELLQNIKNLNKVVTWVRSHLIVNKRNIIILGSFGISYQNLKNKVKGFKPLIKNGNKINSRKTRSKKKKIKYTLENIENVLIFKEMKNINAEVDYGFKNLLQDSKYKGSKNIPSFLKNVSSHYPINIYIKTRINNAK